MKIPAWLVLGLFVLALTSCGSLGISFDRGQLVSNIFENREQLAKADEDTDGDYSPEQEYYLGRAVAAQILGDKQRYTPSLQAESRRYINLLGLSLAWCSTMPETYNGWHFLVLDSSEINAFSAPSGFILVSRELLRCAKSEDEVAAILAHEIGHVTLRHGIGVISSAHRTEARKENAKTVFKGTVSIELPFGISVSAEKMGKLLGVSVLDIAETLVNKGYSREQEYQADAAAIAILQNAGYDPRGLVRMLQVMQTKWKPDGLGFMKTHPSPVDRINAVEQVLASAPTAAAPSATVTAARQARYQAALGKS